MPKVQMFAVLTAILIIAVVSLYGARTAAVWLWRKLRHRPSPPVNKPIRYLRRVSVATGFVCLVCLAYAYFVEPYWPEVTHYTLTSAKLPKGARPIRIVHLSDTHCDAKVRLEEELPNLIAPLKPDLIVFTGDAANSEAGLANFRRLMNSLARIAPVYGVKGNWDNRTPYVFDRTSIHELDGQVVHLRVGGAEICLAGLRHSRPANLDPVLQALPPDKLSIFLYHTPDEVETASAGGADLYLCGHTHGGQVALPVYGAVITLSKYGKRFERGMYRVGATDVHVSRGIGMEGRFAPRIRFCSRPDISLIEIRPAE